MAEIARVRVPSRSRILTNPATWSGVEAAVAAQVETLCTLDRHIHHPDVRDYCNQHGIDVVTDTELLAILRAAESQEED